MKTFNIIVRCLSVETHSVQAETAAEALRLYQAGKASLAGDEPIDTSVERIEEETINPYQEEIKP